ncbi:MULTISPECIES: hypothetical protein [unclassified Clostridioides]|uniref:hypothetical protein n=1 Tax=unclassified Clostridioides TaxID=2635829 RepID=UPI001D100E19|nr:hypothetical protein [Clostridioides sp. ES-S-0171-01]MCC0687915.1 hypothetical protein [Clostridioides sp. ES-S-0056-01]MCC0714603.1 hypothetical protein [Clostridioides sp. ES-S-0077-01]UDN53405.1 hypothetical protein JJC02_10860 [Clostridioides sp. ES-S-0054-01]
MMNIQEYQLKIKEEEIIKRLLNNGDLVTFYEVNKFISEFFEKKIIGLPYFKPITLLPYQNSDKEQFNTMFENIEYDLKSIYEVHNHQVDSSIETVSKYDLEMINIYNEANKIIAYSEIANEFSSKKKSYYPYVITFNTLEDTNTINLVKNNIPKSTCEIDYNTSTLRNELHSIPDDKIDLSKSNLKILSNGQEISTNTNLILNEALNESISLNITPIKNEVQIITIDLELDNIKTISRIELSGYSLQDTVITLLLSSDNKNFKEKFKCNGEKNNIWRFNKEDVLSIKFIIEKYEIDQEEIDNLGSLFVLNNISLYNDKYSKTSVYTSNKINIDEPISNITLNPKNKIPPMTNISYFVGIEDKNNSVEWKSIKPGIALDLNLLYKEEKLLNYYTSDLFGKRDFDIELKNFLFYVQQLPEYVNLNSIEMRTGHSQWMIERLDVSDKYNQEYPSSLKVSINDYAKHRVTGIAPMDANTMEIMCKSVWNYIVMSQYVNCLEETVIENKYFSFEKDKEVFDVIVLVNGRQVFKKDNTYAFKLKKGENKVQIMFLLGKLDLSEPVKTIKHNFNLMSNSDSIFAGSKMERVTYNSLVKDISAHSLKYYAIKSTDNIDSIVVKFDPNYMISPNDPVNIESKEKKIPQYQRPDIKINTAEYFRIFVKYKHMLPSTIEKLKSMDGNSLIRCRVMAKLSTSDISVTPVINNIKVVAE